MYSIVFGEIRHESPESYVRATLTTWAERVCDGQGAVPPAAVEAEAANVVEVERVEPVVAEREEHPELDADQQAELRDRRACVLKDLKQLVPLRDGEVIEEDLFTYLLTPYGDLEPNTIVLRRSTNFATLFVVPERWKLDRDRVLEVDRSRPVEAPLIQPLAKAKSPVAELAGGLGDALLEGVQGEVAGMIIGVIFPDSEPSYFDAVYKTIDKMFKRNLVAIEIRKINGVMNGLKTWMKIDYKNLKKVQRATKKELTDALLPKVDELAVHVMGILQTDPFREPGLQTFLIAAGMHLALLQELAVVDPHTADPTKSAHAASVRDYARKYARFAREQHDRIRKKRSAYFKVFYDPKVSCVLARCITTSQYSWRDEFTGFVGEDYQSEYRNKKLYKSDRTLATEAMEKRRKKVLAELDRRLTHPRQVAAKWEKLEKQPLPRGVSKA